MPYEYLFWLAIVVDVVFVIASITFLWIFIEKRRIKYINMSILCVLVIIAMLILAIWAKKNYDKQEDGIEIERFTKDLDQVFLNYYKKATREGLKYKFKMVLDNESYITINKVDELFSSRYVLTYHITNLNIEHLDEDDYISEDELDMAG